MRHLRSISVKELLKFGVGGGCAVLTDLLGYLLLKGIIGVSSAKAISFILGSGVGFIINKIWTFESKSFSWNEVLKYIILYSISAAINTAVNKLALYLFSSTIFAFLCATGISTMINFIGQKFFVFTNREGKKDAETDNV